MGAFGIGKGWAGRLRDIGVVVGADPGRFRIVRLKWGGCRLTGFAGGLHRAGFLFRRPVGILSGRFGHEMEL